MTGMAVTDLAVTDLAITDLAITDLAITDLAHQRAKALRRQPSFRLRHLVPVRAVDANPDWA